MGLFNLIENWLECTSRKNVFSFLPPLPSAKYVTTTQYESPDHARRLPVSNYWWQEWLPWWFGSIGQCVLYMAMWWSLHSSSCSQGYIRHTITQHQKMSTSSQQSGGSFDPQGAVLLATMSGSCPDVCWLTNGAFDLVDCCIIKILCQLHFSHQIWYILFLHVRKFWMSTVLWWRKQRWSIHIDARIWGQKW